MNCSRTAGVKVWFSAKDLGLGIPMMRAIDKGLANSRIGLVLVTGTCYATSHKRVLPIKNFPPSWLAIGSCPSYIRRRTQELRNVSPLLASRSGLDTSEDSIEVVATKIAELVAIWD